MDFVDKINAAPYIDVLKLFFHLRSDKVFIVNHADISPIDVSKKN